MNKTINQPLIIRCLMALAFMLMPLATWAQASSNLKYSDPNYQNDMVEVTEWSMTWGESLNEESAIYPVLNNPYQVQGIVYSSSNTGVATINTNGFITPVAPGSTKITASYGGDDKLAASTASYTLTYTDDRRDPNNLGFGFSSTTASATYGDGTVTPLSLNMGQLSGASVTYSSSVQSVATVDNTGLVTIKGAGSTEINASFAGDDYTKPGSASYTLTVNPKEVGLTWGTTEFTYDGSAHVPTATATGLVGNDVCTVTVDGAQTNAGSNYTATASALSNANYKLPAANTITFSIAKAVSFLATAPTANSLTYTGSAQALVTAGTASGGTLQYSLDNQTFAEAVPTGTDAGDYTVYYKVEGDVNHEDAAGGQVAVTIAKATPTITFASKTANAKMGETYAGQTATTSPSGLTLKYTSSNTSVATVNESTGAVTLVAAGSTTITAKYAGDTNYNAAEASYTLMVSKADAVEVELSFALDQVTATYGDGTVAAPDLNNPQQLSLTWSSSNVNVATIGSNNVIQILGVGQTDISAAFAGNDTYQAKTASFTLVVNKAAVTVTFDTEAETATLGEPFTSPKATVIPRDLQLVYSSSDKNIAKVEGSTGEVTLRGVGTVKITATFKGSDNYESASAFYELTVLEGTPLPPTLDPIVKEEDYWMDEELFVNADGSEVDLSNTIIDDILFTLKNQSSPEGDGYDTEEKCIVINTSTSNSTVDALLANGVEPGSAEYASQFTGLTFMVPAGDGFVIVTSQEAEGAYLMAKVGDNEPVAIHMEEMGDFDIPYQSDEITIVYLWKAGTDEANDTRTRGKKMMTDVKIKGVSHKSKGRSGIQQVVFDNNADQPWYDLSGQWISKPVKKGVYIHGNRKVVIK